MATNVKKDISDVIVNTDALAGLLGFTRQRVNQLAKEGILEKKAPGRFPLMLNIKRYVEFLRTGQKDEEEEATAQYWEEKALHEKAKRELAELKLAKQKNQLHDAADIEIAISNMLVTFRTRILGVPQKVAPQIIGLTNLAEVMEVINTELTEVLTELSEYDPSMFAGGDDIEEEDDETVSKDAQTGCSSSKNNY